MSLIQDLRESTSLTDREESLRDYLLEHPENIQRMSSRKFAEITFTSAATVTRFCRKFDCEGWPDFKLRFISELKAGHGMEPQDSIHLSNRENMATLLKKTSDAYGRALEATQRALSLSQMVRIQKLLQTHLYIDFYAYDANIHLARYASSQFFHAGKIAASYSETDIQVLSALTAPQGHLAVLISHTGENKKLIALARLLHQNGTKMIIITSSRESTLGKNADEYLFAPRPSNVGEVETDKLSIPIFFTATKYLLDLMFAIAFSEQYAENMSLNQRYDVIGAATFWDLNEPS